MPRHTIAELQQLAADALKRAGASERMAAATASALVAAEAEGLASLGLSRVAQYAAQLRTGRVNGHARPGMLRVRASTCLVDADEGLAFPACALAVQEAIAHARETGACFAAVTRSHHFGAAAYHLRPVVEARMVGLAFGNSPAVMPAWGGKRALFGADAIAAAFPRRFAPPLVIDLMLPAAGAKGAMLTLMVELLCCAFSGASYGYEADPFLSDTGNRPQLGQSFLVLDPGALAGPEVFHERIESLIETMLADPDVRLPGARRQARMQAAEADGIEVDEALMAQLRSLAALS